MAKTVTLTMADDVFTRVIDAIWNNPNNVRLGPEDDPREAEDLENPTVQEKAAHAKKQMIILLKNYVKRIEIDIQRQEAISNPPDFDIE